MCNIKKRYENLCRSKQEISESNNTSRVQQHVNSFHTPIFAKELFISSLEDIGFSHVTCNADTISACVALGSYLRCPVIANSSELFLFEFEEPNNGFDRFVYIPLRSLSTQPVPHPSNPNAMCLVAHVFSPSSARIHRIPYNLRPFFAIYFKPPGGKHFPLPDRIGDILNRRQKHCDRESDSQMVLRAKELVVWLECARSPLEILEECLEQLKDDKIILSFIQELVIFTMFLKFDFKQGEMLAHYLFSNELPKKDPLITSTDLISCLTIKESYPESLIRYINLIKAEYSSFRCEMTELLSMVPQNFLRSYRSGLLSAVVFSRMLSRTVVLQILTENPIRESVMECSRGLRYLQYCLLCYFFKHCGFEISHLRDSNPEITEISRSTKLSCFRRCIIRLEPFPVIFEDSVSPCISLIQTYFGYRLKCIDNWMEMLAFVLSLWHSSTYPGVVFNILDHPTALAIALIVCSIETSDGGLNVCHLNELADGMACNYNIDVVHEINELQIIYISLVSLFRFVNAIGYSDSDDNGNPKSEKILQAERIFPCSRLIHNVAVTLAGSSERKSLDVWLSKLLAPIHNPDCLSKATVNMIYFTKFLCEMRAIRPIKFSSIIEQLSFSDFDTISGKTTLSISQRESSFGRKSVSQNYQHVKHQIRSPQQRTYYNNGSGNPHGSKDNRRTNIGPSSDGINVPSMTRNINQSFSKSNDVNLKSPMRHNGSFVQTRTDSRSKNENLKNSTNPFLPNYNPGSGNNRRFSFPKAPELNNPFLPDFNISNQQCASECGEIQGRISYPYFQRKRVGTSELGSECGFQMLRERHRPTMRQGGLSKSVKNHSNDIDPTILTKTNRSAVSENQNQGNDKTLSNLRKGILESRPNASFNGKYPLRDSGNLFNNPRVRRGKSFRPSGGPPRRGGTFNGGPIKDNNLGKNDWTLDGISNEVEKLALDFS